MLLFALLAIHYFVCGVFISLCQSKCHLLLHRKFVLVSMMLDGVILLSHVHLHHIICLLVCQGRGATSSRPINGGGVEDSHGAKSNVGDILSSEVCCFICLNFLDLEGRIGERKCVCGMAKHRY